MINNTALSYTITAVLLYDTQEVLDLAVLSSRDWWRQVDQYDHVNEPTSETS
jgi:hypothetical protein